MARFPVLFENEFKRDVGVWGSKPRFYYLKRPPF